jgi:UvrD-like helicase C-terminal domain
MPMTIDIPRGWRTRLQTARDPGLLAVVGAVLLMCAPAFPGLYRLVVLPALLLAPGYALLRLLGQATGMRSVSVVVPLSLVLAISASLVLDASGIRLGPLSLGLLLGAVTALLLAASYGRQVAASPLWPHRSTPAAIRSYERPEVRDLLAYLRLIANPGDEVSLRRALSVPRRRIDDGAEKSVAAMAQWDRTSFAVALARPGDVPGLSPDAIRARPSTSCSRGCGPMRTRACRWRT